MSVLIALVLVGHALMHVGAVSCGLLFSSTPAGIVTGTGLDLGLVRSSAVLLTTLTVAGYLLAALAAVGIAVPRGWWRPLVVVASVASAVLLAGLFSPPALPGLVLDALFVGAVLGRSWQPAPVGR